MENAKCQRPSVCNAAETFLIHKAIAVPIVHRPVFHLILHSVQQVGEQQSAAGIIGIPLIILFVFELRTPIDGRILVKLHMVEVEMQTELAVALVEEVVVHRAVEGKFAEVLLIENLVPLF